MFGSWRGCVLGAASGRDGRESLTGADAAGPLVVDEAGGKVAVDNLGVPSGGGGNGPADGNLRAQPLAACESPEAESAPFVGFVGGFAGGFAGGLDTLASCFFGGSSDSSSSSSSSRILTVDVAGSGLSGRKVSGLIVVSTFLISSSDSDSSSDSTTLERVKVVMAFAAALGAGFGFAAVAPPGGLRGGGAVCRGGGCEAAFLLGVCRGVSSSSSSSLSAFVAAPTLMR